MEYKAFTPKNALEIDKLYSIHYFAYAKDFTFTGERHDFWEMAYVDNGEVGIIADGKGYTLRQGEAVFHKPMEYHNIWANQKYAHVVILSFSSQSPMMSFFKNKILTLDNEDKALLRHIIAEAEKTFAEPLDIVDLTEMTQRKDAPAGGAQLVRLYMEALLIGLSRKNSAVLHAERVNTWVEDENEGNIVQVIRNMLLENLQNAITLDDICGQLCFSKTYIKALFKRQTGTSIMQYLIHLRITAAKRLLDEGTKSCAEIAESVGFSSIHYFSRTFKKRTGMTPTAYAKSVKSRKIL